MHDFEARLAVLVDVDAGGDAFALDDDHPISVQDQVVDLRRVLIPLDPEPMEYAVENVRKFVGKVPGFGICLGHQVCGLALGGKTFKLKFGHHGSNHPVKNLLTNQVEITAQNHGFCVDPESLPSSDVEVTHLNLNDHTNEGMRHKNLPLFSVQYHPEASPGPHDSHYLFTQFTDLMKEWKQPGSSRR